MKQLMKYLGVLIQIVGILLLIVPYFNRTTTNTTLITGGGLIALGLIVHIVLNRWFIKE